MGVNLLEQAVIDVDDLVACIEKLYRNPLLRKTHAAASVDFAKTLDWDNLIPQWLEIINGVN